MKIRTSKYVLSNQPPQKPLAAMSRHASSWVLAVAPARTPPVIGCRSGSMQTSLQTSGRRLAVRFLISLCLMGGKPPLGQNRACCTENLAPHPQVDGVFRGGQLYQRTIASRNAPLWSAKPNSLTAERLARMDKVHRPLEGVRDMYFQILGCLHGLLPPQLVHIYFCFKLLCNDFISVLKVLLNDCFLQGLCDLG